MRRIIILAAALACALQAGVAAADHVRGRGCFTGVGLARGLAPWGAGRHCQYVPRCSWGPGWGGSSFSLSVGWPGGLSYSRGFVSGRSWFAPAPLVYDPCWYTSSASYYSGAYGVYYRPDLNYVDYALPPVYAPAELAYGPQAMNRFLGPPRDFATRPLVEAPRAAPAPRWVEASPREEPAAASPAEAAVDLAPELPREPRISNADTRAKARRVIAAGDGLFAKQRYHEALQQYKAATRLAPDLGEAYFRQGHALTATHRHDLAWPAYRRGAEVDPEWLRSDFRLDDLYAGNHVAKDGHLDALAAAALEQPDRADYLLMLGIFLRFDGQAERAEKFIARARALTSETTRALAER